MFAEPIFRQIKCQKSVFNNCQVFAKMIQALGDESYTKNRNIIPVTCSSHFSINMSNSGAEIDTGCWPASLPRNTFLWAREDEKVKKWTASRRSGYHVHEQLVFMCVHNIARGGWSLQDNSNYHDKKKLLKQASKRRFLRFADSWWCGGEARAERGFESLSRWQRMMNIWESI